MACKQNPATLAACGAAVIDLAGASISSDNSYSESLLPERALAIAKVEEQSAREYFEALASLKAVSA